MGIKTLYDNRINEPDCEKCSKGRIYSEREIRTAIIGFMKACNLKVDTEREYDNIEKKAEEIFGKEFMRENNERSI